MDGGGHTYIHSICTCILIVWEATAELLMYTWFFIWPELPSSWTLPHVNCLWCSVWDLILGYTCLPHPWVTKCTAPCHVDDYFWVTFNSVFVTTSSFLSPFAHFVSLHSFWYFVTICVCECACVCQLSFFKKKEKKKLNTCEALTL